MSAPDVLWVGLAGSAGAAARFAIDGSIRARRPSRVPIGTIAINLSGSFVLGILAGMMVFHDVGATVVLVAGTGFCGGYTTFSTTSFETVRLIQQGYARAASVSLLVTLTGAVAAAAGGMALASL